MGDDADLELYLTTCQVGITASSIAVGIVAEPALVAIFEPLFAGSRLAGIGAGAEHDVDLIVMGATGQSGLKEHLLGSTADRVTQSVDVSVLIARP